MKPMKYLFYFLICFLLLLPATGSFASVEMGPLSIGGAMRANYIIGDYGPELDRASRAQDDGGTFALDVFRFNVGFQQDAFIGKAEYRFYPGYGTNNHDGYHMLHTGWVGYNFEDTSQIQVGVNRVPFGPGAYGVSQSFFFDQHYYVGLADDMDLGVKYSRTFDNLALDLAYYASDEGTYNGANFSNDSVRYSYDVVDETGNGYEERNQFNVRAIYTIERDAGTTALGTSLQYGELKSNGPQDDGSHYAASLHGVFKFSNITLATQATYYEYDVEYQNSTGDQELDTLVQMGAFDFPSLAAAEAWIPAVSLSYFLETPQVDWLEYVIPYVEYSSIVKAEDGFNDSELVDIGAAWGSGGWYIYTDLVFSNGNDFVGNEAGYGSYPDEYFNWASNRHGANPTDKWEYRFNINFGYYF
jgi:hypothetical protein